MIGVIGTGRWGTNIINTLDRLGIEHVCCNTEGVYNGKPCEDNWLDLIRQVRPQGLIVAANPALHMSILKYAELFSMPMMIEKPAAFYLSDVHKMQKAKVPILVDYIHLFDPKWKALRTQLRAPIAKVTAIAVDDGPFRHFSSLFDFGPHPLSEAFDLVSGSVEIVSSKVKRNHKGGRLYQFDLTVGPTEVSVLCGNGADHKKHLVEVTLSTGDVLTYEDKGGSTDPLDNAIRHFQAVVNGAAPKPSIDLTASIHEVFHRLGNNWKKESKK